MRVYLLVLFGLLTTAPAYAADQCKDVLIEKVLDSTTIQVTREVQLAALSRLTSNISNTDEVKTSAKFPIEGIPVEGRGDWMKSRKSDFSNSLDLNLLVKEAGSLVLQSGQAEIIKAWRQCMADNQGGVGAYFSLVGDGRTQVFLHVEYLARSQSGGSPQVPLRLTEDVYLEPGVRAVAGKDCLSKDFVIRPGENCIAQMIVPSAWTVVPIVMSFQADSDTKSRVYVNDTLLPRVTAVVESQNVSFDVPRSVPGVSTSYTYALHSQSNPPVCHSTPKGYTFAGNVNVLTTPRGASIANKSCQHDISISPTREEVCIQTRFVNTPAKADYYCDWKVQGVAAKLVWAPAKE